MERPIGIQVDCPDCSEIWVEPESVTVRVCMDDAEWSYWFVCPSCRLRAASSTREDPALQAVAAGSRFESWQLPAELGERREGPPFDLMDVLELKRELMRPDCIDVLRQGI